MCNILQVYLAELAHHLHVISFQTCFLTHCVSSWHCLCSHAMQHQWILPATNQLHEIILCAMIVVLFLCKVFSTYGSRIV